MENCFSFFKDVSNSGRFKHIAFALNGGKDSVVTFDLVKKFSQLPVKTWFFWNKNEFLEVRKFLDELCQQNHIDLLVLSHEKYKTMKDVLSFLKDELGVDACIEGHRLTDGQLLKNKDTKSVNDEKIIETDQGWPAISRILPILHWSYHDVWSYILKHEIAVVSLYEREGYTSLGSMGTTFPNYLLWDQKNSCYMHASLLKDESAERSGRLKTPLPFLVSGKVVHGKGQGKKLGYATANLDFSLSAEKIKHGVYGGYAQLIGKEKELAVCSVGPNITFGETHSSFEVHLIDESGKPKLLDDFYGETLEMEITFYLRPMLKFDNVSQLIEQIEEDIHRFLWHSSKVEK